MAALSIHNKDKFGNIKEVYVYINGRLSYKRWVNGKSMVFNKGEHPYTKKTALSVTQDEDGNIVKTYS